MNYLIKGPIRRTAEEACNICWWDGFVDATLGTLAIVFGLVLFGLCVRAAYRALRARKP